MAACAPSTLTIPSLFTLSSTSAKALKSFAVVPKYLFAHLLADFLGVAGELAQHRNITFHIRQHVGIDVSDGPDYRLADFIVGKIGGVQKLRRTVEVFNGFEQVRVAVGNKGEDAGYTVEEAEPAVCSSLHPHLFPKPGSAKIAGYDLARSVQFVSLPVQVRAFSNVVYLRGDHYPFEFREKPGLP